MPVVGIAAAAGGIVGRMMGRNAGFSRWSTVAADPNDEGVRCGMDVRAAAIAAATHERIRSTEMWSMRNSIRNRDGDRFRCVLRLWLCGMLLATGGCHWAGVPGRRGFVSSELTSRFGHGISTSVCPGQSVIPPDVSLDDGITEDEAVHIALWNNAALLELLTDLGISRAQLLSAGLISDPQFIVFFPLGPKQLEFIGYQSVDTFWLRPIRRRVATRDLNQVSESMVQNGLNTIRDARVAHADLVQAQQQSDVARDAESIREQIAELARKRLAAGDISELEAATSQIDALQAKAAAARAVHDVSLAQHRLRTVLGLTMLDAPILATEREGSGVIEEDAEALISTALAMRPDLRAAEIGIEAACERIGLANHQFMTLDAIYDANGQGIEGFESGPGLRFTVPIFNGNRGGIAIAKAQWQKAARQYVTVRDQITLDVRTAHTQLLQARENLRLVQSEILPATKEAELMARRNYQSGGATYFLVLQTTGPYLDARMRESLLIADVQRATAELERSVGTRLVIPPPVPPLEDEMIAVHEPMPKNVPPPITLEAVGN